MVCAYQLIAAKTADLDKLIIGVSNKTEQIGTGNQDSAFFQQDFLVRDRHIYFHLSPSCNHS